MPPLKALRKEKSVMGLSSSIGCQFRGSGSQ